MKVSKQQKVSITRLMLKAVQSYEGEYVSRSKVLDAVKDKAMSVLGSPGETEYNKQIEKLWSKFSRPIRQQGHTDVSWNGKGGKHAKYASKEDHHKETVSVSTTKTPPMPAVEKALKTAHINGATNSGPEALWVVELLYEITSSVSQAMGSWLDRQKQASRKAA